MEQEVNNYIVELENTTIPVDTSRTIEDYSGLLKKFDLAYLESEHHYHIKIPTVRQGWILHITVIPVQMEQLLKAILPELVSFNIPFKIIKNSELHKKTNAGVYGQFKIGKIITIYLDNDLEIEPLVEKLIELTKEFTGPQVFTDFTLGNVLFTRYGSFIPMVETDNFGNKVRLIYDGPGNLIYDKYYTPPLIPNGISNPFVSFIKRMPEQPKIYLIGNKYMPVKLLKADPKGNVWKALYFTKYFMPKWCVIKQGRKGMFPDEHARDARDRISWQYYVNKAFKNSIPAPGILDYFEDEGQAYITIQYVKKGKDFRRVIFNKLKNAAWFDQPQKLRLKVLGYLLQVIDVIRVIHKRNYVHRDITATNFLVTKSGRVHPIDLELIYSITENKPDPPFEVGTVGYMSPEQELGIQTPNLKDDIYSLGALMIMMFTSGLSPHSIIEPDRDELHKKLFFLIGDWEPVNLIAQCVSLKADERPDIETLYSEVSNYETRLKSEIQQNKPQIAHNASMVNKIIKQAIQALSGDLMVHNDLWYSHIENEYGWDIYPLGNKHVFGGLYRGTGGVLWLLGKLHKAGYDITPVGEKIGGNLQFIKSEMAAKIDNITPSLYYGTAGMAVALCQSIQSGFIPDNFEYRSIIRDCFKKPAPTFDLIYGIAGQGISALQCLNYIDKETLNTILNEYANILINAQQKDGSWLNQANSPKKADKPTGFGYGAAGIIYFLLEYGRQNNNGLSIQAAVRGLDSLTKRAKKRKDHYEWSDSDQNKAIGHWWCKGAPGIALSYLKAFEVTQNYSYKKIAEKALQIHPKNLVQYKLSQCHGISGLGEIYLEAYRITKNQEWWNRAVWIANLLINFRKQTPSGCTFWVIEKNDFPTADFMVGNSGIIHFLFRICNPDRIGFPLLS